jgi:hypothetical protein
VSKIGCGNSGDVFLGIWKGINVALKTMPSNSNEIVREGEILSVIF